jgi:uncharacterized protein YxeA
MNNKYLILYLSLLIIILIIISLIVYKKQIIDSFDNLESNLYTYDSCCTQDNIANCEKYGKTGVCNYYKDNKSCMCQNSF